MQEDQIPSNFGGSLISFMVFPQQCHLVVHNLLIRDQPIETDYGSDPPDASEAIRLGAKIPGEWETCEVKVE